MADKKITQLTDLGAGLAKVDLFHVVDDPTGTPINKSIRTQDVFQNIPTWIGLNSTSQSITGDGSTSTAINVTKDTSSPVTEVDATSAGAPCTLANGENGQIVIILNVSTTGTNAVVITPSNLRGGTTITLNAPGESVMCIFKNSNWNVIGGHNFTVA
jgi:hypothetical protein